jgi:hypothetical protein
MNASLISALAACAGAMTGGLTSVLASLLTQRTRARAQWLTQDKVRREDLYREFTEEASKSYIDALQHDKVDVPEMVILYAKIGQMRIVSSAKVIAIADQIGLNILDTYLQPNKSLPDLMEMVRSKSFDLLRDFSEACREEFESLRAQQF